MGAYLSEPITKKISSDDCGKNVAFGASSMQGWRISQEDAHNCCIDFDEETSLFAVYDGHGGHEVATYCAKELPAFIKNTEAYKNGDIKQALIDAFLGFDAALARPDIIKVLKEIAGTINNVDNGRDKRETHCPPDEDEESVSDLRMEAAMPLEQVMARYSMWQRETKDTDDGRWHTGPSCSSSGHSWGAEQDTGGSSQSSAAQKNENEAGEVSSDRSNGESSNGLPDAASSADPTRPESARDSGDRTELPKKVIGSVGETLENGVAREHEQYAALPHADEECGRRSRKIKRTVMEKRREMEEDEDDDDDDDDDDEDDATFDGSPNASDDDTEDAGDDEEQDSSDDDPEQNDKTTQEEEEEDEDDDDDDEDDDDEDDGEFTMDMTEEPGSDSGCTAVVAILHRKELYVANAGDSRCVLCRDGQALELSLDHKPEDEPEMERIVKAGGKVTADGRVNGGLNLSRALGDHAYKQNTTLLAHEQMISALPDVRHIAVEPNRDEFMILACDGIWNFMSSQEVVTFVRPRLMSSDQPNISKICEELFDHCLATDTLGDGTGCDNMTAVIVKFNRPADPSEVCSKKRPISPSTVDVTNCENSSGQSTRLEESKSSEDTSKRQKTEAD